MQSSWPNFAAETRVGWGNLIVDLVTVIAIQLSFIATTEYWIRRRGGLFRFRILDMLVFITVCGLVLGWYQHHARMQHKEIALASEITGADWSTAFDFGTARRVPNPASERVMATEFYFTGPDWLLRLIGGERMLPVLKHRTRAEVFVTADWKDDVSELEAWPYLREIEFFSVLPHSAIEILGKLARLESLSIRTHEGVAHEWMLGRYGLEENGGLVGPHDYSDLACLRLERLTLENRELTAKDVERITSQLSTLRVLELIEPMATPDEIEQLRQRYPGLTLIVDWPIEPPPERATAFPATAQQETETLKRLQAEAIEKQAAEANSAL